MGKDCKLTYLGLNGNQLTRVPRRLLARCSNLRHLNLGYNQIAHLDDLALLTTPMNKPSIISSSGDGASSGGATSRLSRLSTLVLRNNPIYSLAFSGTGVASGSHLLLHNHHHQQHHQHQHGLLENNGVNGVDINSNNKGITGGMLDNSVESPGMAAVASSSSYHVFPAVPNVFRTEAFPNLYELSLSFCQLSDLVPFPSLPLTNLEISMGLKSATTVTPQMFEQLKDLEWLALDHNSLQNVR